MPTRNVNLADHYDSFIDDSIAAGRFSNASEAVRAGLHLLERQQAEDQAKIEWLRGARPRRLLRRSIGAKASRYRPPMTSMLW